MSNNLNVKEIVVIEDILGKSKSFIKEVSTVYYTPIKVSEMGYLINKTWDINGKVLDVEIEDDLYNVIQKLYDKKNNEDVKDKFLGVLLFAFFEKQAGRNEIDMEVKFVKAQGENFIDYEKVLGEA